MATTSTTGTTPASIRFPQSLRERLRRRAERERRSFSSEWVVLLEQALGDDGVDEEEIHPNELERLEAVYLDTLQEHGVG